MVSTAFHLIWVYEITPSLILDDVSSNAPLSANALQTGPTVTGTGSEEFYLAITAAHSFPPDSSKVIASVSSPWVLDPTVLGGDISNYDWGTYFTATTATLIGAGAAEQAQFAFTSSAPAKWAIGAVALRQSVPTLSVTPSSVSFINRVWGFSPHLGNTSAVLNITASGSWSCTASEWLDVQPSSGTGNGTVTVTLSETGLPLATNGVTRVDQGTYTGEVEVTDGSTTVQIPVVFNCGYGDTVGTGAFIIQ